eukprot:gnl/TRDRNA2_/TRDRNA2_133241_c0_seq1.p1 gnl/TRDRNA2_/TRDRNA2_133241_c0~~gnl/TRDRNA2_/TRDRNA2_133241_c0_seq1.p1  ORF type:complete len:165 (+),score=20.98 gnl/TRDRNA2_/TRDRNA2_133241_c0_seq1:71-565(+)
MSSQPGRPSARCGGVYAACCCRDGDEATLELNVGVPVLSDHAGADAVVPSPQANQHVVSSKERDGLQDASAPVLQLGFRTNNGAVTEVRFRWRPLGFNFEHRAPIVITQLQHMGVAEEMGVKQGWVVVSINGEEVANKDFAYQYDRIRKISKTLPPTTARSSRS